MVLSVTATFLFSALMLVAGGCRLRNWTIVIVEPFLLPLFIDIRKKYSAGIDRISTREESALEFRRWYHFFAASSVLMLLISAFL